MKITQFIKQLNGTEVGEGNTNDCYVAIPGKVDLTKILPTNQPLELTDVSDGTIYTTNSSRR